MRAESYFICVNDLLGSISNQQFDSNDVEKLYKLSLMALAEQGMFPEVRNNLERYSPELHADVIHKLIEVSAENEHYEMTAYLLDYQYKHNLFHKSELCL